MGRGGQELAESRITCMDILAHWANNCNLLIIRDLQAFNYFLQRQTTFITKQALTEILKFLNVFLFYRLVAFIICKNVYNESNVNLIPTISGSDTKCIIDILLTINDRHLKSANVFTFVFFAVLFTVFLYICLLSFVSVDKQF